MTGLVNIKEEIKADVLVLRMSGQLDAISSPAAECKVFDFIHQGHHKILIDLNGIELMSSAGIRMLLSVSKKFKTISGKLIVCSLSPIVVDLINRCGFAHVFEVAKDEDDGLHKF